jgi:hypothetical protein
VLPRVDGSTMHPNPPRCDKCREPMNHMASMPSLDTPGKTVTVFYCEPCDRLKWIEGKAASGLSVRPDTHS